MLTIERTEEWVIVKLPPTVTDEELRALEEAYTQTVQKEPSVETERRSLAIPGYMDEDGYIIDEDILKTLRSTRIGVDPFDRIKEMFGDKVDIDELKRKMEEE